MKGLRCTLFRAGLALASLLSTNTFTYLLLFITTQPEASCIFYKGMSDRQRDGPTMYPLGNPWPPVGGISALLGEAKGEGNGWYPKWASPGSCRGRTGHSILLCICWVGQLTNRVCQMLNLEVAIHSKSIIVCAFDVYGVFILVWELQPVKEAS